MSGNANQSAIHGSRQLVRQTFAEQAGFALLFRAFRVAIVASISAKRAMICEKFPGDRSQLQETSHAV
jgi:hypothetical protein